MNSQCTKYQMMGKFETVLQGMFYRRGNQLVVIYMYAFAENGGQDGQDT